MSLAEIALRERLQELANQPGPPSLADRALAGARRARRRRAGLLTAAGLALAVVAALSSTWVFPAPTGVAVGGPVPCETATDESTPRRGVPQADVPAFVQVVLGVLPARDDYTLESAVGICGTEGYAVIAIGPDRQYGHLAIRIYSGDATSGLTCAEMRMPNQPLLSCTDATATAPLVMVADSGQDSFVVAALYRDGRAVSVEANQTPFDLARLRAVVADRVLVDLLN